MSPELKCERVLPPQLHLAFLVSNKHLIAFPTIEAIASNHLQATAEAIIRTDPSFESPIYPGIPVVTLRGTTQEKDQRLADTLEDFGANCVIRTDNWIPIGPITRTRFGNQILTLEFNPTSGRTITRTEHLPKGVQEAGFGESADSYSVYIELDEFGKRIPITCGSYKPSYDSIREHEFKRAIEAGIGIAKLLTDVSEGKVMVPQVNFSLE